MVYCVNFGRMWLMKYELVKTKKEQYLVLDRKPNYAIVLWSKSVHSWREHPDGAFLIAMISASCFNEIKERGIGRTISDVAFSLWFQDDWSLHCQITDTQTKPEYRANKCATRVIESLFKYLKKLTDKEIKVTGFISHVDEERHPLLIHFWGEKFGFKLTEKNSEVTEYGAELVLSGEAKEPIANFFL